MANNQYERLFTSFTHVLGCSIKCIVWIALAISPPWQLDEQGMQCDIGKLTHHSTWYAWEHSDRVYWHTLWLFCYPPYTDHILNIENDIIKRSSDSKMFFCWWWGLVNWYRPTVHSSHDWLIMYISRSHDVPLTGLNRGCLAAPRGHLWPPYYPWEKTRTNFALYAGSRPAHHPHIIKTEQG